MLLARTLASLLAPLASWRTGALAGSPAEEMAKVFMWIPLPIIAVPWGYVLRNYVLWSNKKLSHG